MARVSVDLPEQFSFTTSVLIRISDINYGGHAGNDMILSLAHEARVQFLKKAGYSELNLEGIGLIIADAAVEYKSELFHGETVFISVKAAGFTKMSFDIFYKMEKETPTGRVIVAKIKTGMIGYNYTAKKISSLPENAVAKLSAL